jgi:hypothetical protein
MVRIGFNARGYWLPLCGALLFSSVGAQGHYESVATAFTKAAVPGGYHPLSIGAVSQHGPNLEPYQLVAKKEKDLSPDERKKLKKYKERFESLPPEERQRIRAAREKYKQMSPEEKESLRRKWENMSEEEKHQYKLNRGGN